jgi:hypothetical protein
MINVVGMTLMWVAALLFWDGHYDYGQLQPRSLAWILWFIHQVVCVSLMVSAGYVAARMAGKSEIPNAGLSGIVTVIVIIGITIATGGLERFRADFPLYAGIFILGLLGGYLRMRRARRAR